MSDRFLDGYEQQIVAGAGLSVGPGRVKVVKHTTETGPGSLDALIRHWRDNWGAGLPHFGAEGSRIVQLLPLDVGAYTLENAPGGADTNRSGPAIQMERVRFSADPMTDEEYEADGRWLADLVRAGVDLDLSQHPRFYGANEGIVLASYSSPIRMTAAQYQEFNGFCGHQHVPENAHWDPGGIDGDRLERIARQHLGAPAPTPGDDEMQDADWVRIAGMINGARDETVREVYKAAAVTAKAVNDRSEVLRDELAALERAIDAGNDAEVGEILARLQATDTAA